MPTLLAALFQHPVPPEDQERKLVARMHAGDAEARDLLILGHLRLIPEATRRFRRMLPAEDRFSLGCIGLCLALDSFDPDRGARFATYAYRSIQWSVISALASAGEWRNCSSADDDLQELPARDGTADHLRRREEAQNLAELFRFLNPRQQEVLRLRFWECQTLADISVRLGISRERVRQIEESALNKLRRYLLPSECTAA